MMDRRLELVRPWLGTMTDEEVAEKLSHEYGLAASNYDLSKWRRQLGIPAGPKRPRISDEERKAWIASYRRSGSIAAVARAFRASDVRVRLALEDAGVIPSRDARSSTAGRDSTGTG
jgi:transposase-like protein